MNGDISPSPTTDTILAKYISNQNPVLTQSEWNRVKGGILYSLRGITLSGQQ